MIGPPLNDGDCLGQLTALVTRQLEQYAPVACRFRSTIELATWIRSRPQRSDFGDPADGPKITCDVPQRVRVPATADPNCFERAALYLGAAELIDPVPLRQLATIGDDVGRWRHTFPVENGRPVVLDPDLGNAAADRTRTAIARNAMPTGVLTPPTREQQLLGWICELAMAPAVARGGEEALQHVLYAREILARLGMLDNVPRRHACSLTLERLRAGDSSEAAQAQYDLGLVVALAEEGAAATDRPNEAMMYVAIAGAMLQKLGVFGRARNGDQILDPYGTPAARTSATSAPLLDPYSSPASSALPPIPPVLDPYPTPTRPTAPTAESLGTLSPIATISVPSLPRVRHYEPPPDRYSPNDEENSLWSGIALAQRLKAESDAKAAVTTTPSRHHRQVLDPLNDPELAAILDASLAASSRQRPSRNCNCGGACGACQAQAVAVEARSAVVAKYRNCGCGGTCGPCRTIGAALPRNFDWQTVGDIVHTIGGAILTAYGGGALVKPIGDLEASIGMTHKPKPSNDTKSTAASSVASMPVTQTHSEPTQAVLAKLTPDEQAKAKAILASLPDGQRQQLVAYLAKMSPDDAAAFVRSHLGSAPASANASSAATAQTSNAS